MSDTRHPHYPDERGTGLQPLSKRLAARQSAQWAATWGKEMAALEASRKAQQTVQK